MNLGLFMFFAAARSEKMTLTVTESCVEERLNPQPTACAMINKASTKHSVPYALMRSTSFDRIRQFPTYFCRQGSAEIYQWLFSSKTSLTITIPHVAKQINRLLLALAVYGCLGIVATLFATCLFMIVTNQIPIGLKFLITCVIIIGSIALRILFPQPPPVRKSRTLQRRQTTIN
ncbi:Hypothetical protein NTJ_07246 [Nesidiocoris tenuis]|uniref:G-protein coupled receptors family 3 profile domain-containing protein n=1 Tax=Nesidiocoris tenuis TaxID=355587 RepID=A0ABN7ASX2_9HEMI|nr:Hypothetical protein NTJ_07246 [Nesidiocoris tenuis]